MSHFQHGSNFNKGTTTRTPTRGIQLDCNRTNQCQGIAMPTIKLLGTNYKRTITLTGTLLRVLRILHTAWWLPMTFLLESWIRNKPKDELWSTGNLIDAIKLAQISENHEPVWNTFPRSSGALVGHRTKTPFRIPTLKLHLLRTALRRGHPSFFVLSSVQWQVLQTATKYCFGLIWCCCFTEEDIVLQNIEDLALAASTKTPDSWQHVYRWRGRPDRSFSQSLAHRLNSLLVSSWTEMHRLHIKYDPMSAFSACVNPKTANMNNQQFTENSFIAIYHSNGLYHRLLRPRIHTRHKWLISRHT